MNVSKVPVPEKVTGIFVCFLKDKKLFFFKENKETDIKKISTKCSDRVKNIKFLYLFLDIKRQKLILTNYIVILMLEKYVRARFCWRISKKLWKLTFSFDYSTSYLVNRKILINCRIVYGRKRKLEINFRGERNEESIPFNQTDGSNIEVQRILFCGRCCKTVHGDSRISPGELPRMCILRWRENINLPRTILNMISGL